MEDGESIRMTGDHRVLVRDYRGKRSVMPLDEFRESHRFLDGRRRLWLVAPDAMVFDGDPDLPLPPYFVGAMLGDGGMTQSGTVTFTNQDEEVLSRVFRESGAEWVSHPSQPDYTYHARLKNSNLSGELRSLGMVGVECGEKRVPDLYMRSPVQDRLHLLAGLVDTDGHLYSRGGRPEGGGHFVSKSSGLADDFAWLVRSVGGRVTRRWVQEQGGTPYHNIRWYCEIPSEMASKRAVCHYDTSIRGVTKIVPDAVEECYDIGVDHPDHLFAAGVSPVMVHNSYGGVLSAIDGDGNVFFVAEHLQEGWPDRKHAAAFQRMEKKYATGQVERYADPGSAGAQSIVNMADSGLYFNTMPKGKGSVSASIKKLRGLTYVDPSHTHPINGTKGAPRVYFYRPGLVATHRDENGRMTVGCKLAEQISEARQTDNESAPADTPHKDIRSKLDLFDCARYTAVLASDVVTSDDDDGRLVGSSDRLPTDMSLKKGSQSDPHGHPMDQEIWLPEYTF